LIKKLSFYSPISLYSQIPQSPPLDASFRPFQSSIFQDAQDFEPFQVSFFFQFSFQFQTTLNFFLKNKKANKDFSSFVVNQDGSFSFSIYFCKINK